MRKLIFILLSVMLLGCSKDDEQNKTTENQDNLYLIKKEYISYTNPNYNYSLVYSYNGGKVVSILNNSNIKDGREYIYAGDKISKIKIYDNGVYLSNNDLTYTYEGENIVSRSGYEDNILFRHDYKYNSLGQLFESKQYDNNILCCTSTYTYDSKGNIYSYQNDGFTGINYYKVYDNYKNPDYYVFSKSVAKVFELSPNNLISEEENSTSVISYTYNEKGYPTEAISKMNGTVVSKVIYTYQ